MSRTVRRKKDPPHCKVLGCSICEDVKIKEAQNRAYKLKKQKGKL